MMADEAEIEVFFWLKLSYNSCQPGCALSLFGLPWSRCWCSRASIQTRVQMHGKAEEGSCNNASRIAAVWSMFGDWLEPTSGNWVLSDGGSDWSGATTNQHHHPNPNHHHQHHHHRHHHQRHHQFHCQNSNLLVFPRGFLVEVGRGLGGGSPLTTGCWFAPPHSVTCWRSLSYTVWYGTVGALCTHHFLPECSRGWSRSSWAWRRPYPPSLPLALTSLPSAPKCGRREWFRHAQAESSNILNFRSKLPLAPVNVHRIAQYNSFQII